MNGITRQSKATSYKVVANRLMHIQTRSENVTVVWKWAELASQLNDLHSVSLLRMIARLVACCTWKSRSPDQQREYSSHFLVGSACDSRCERLFCRTHVSRRIGDESEQAFHRHGYKKIVVLPPKLWSIRSSLMGTYSDTPIRLTRLIRSQSYRNCLSNQIREENL